MNATSLSRPPAGPASPGSARRGKPALWLVLSLYGAAYLLLQLGASPLRSHPGIHLWYIPAALSVFMLLCYGPKVLPAVILAPLPVDLLFRPPAHGPWILLALSGAFGLALTLGVMVFRRAGLSPRLRRIQDVGGFIALAFLGPFLGAFTLWLFMGPSPLSAGTLRPLFLSHALGVLTLGPALLLWIRPLLRLGLRPAGPCLAPPRMEALLQVFALVLTTLVVVRFSEPGTLHLKYLLFLPMTWMAVRGGLKAVSLGFPLLGLSLGLAVLHAPSGPQAILGIQSFTLVLFGTTLFLGSAVDAHLASRSGRERGARRLHHLLEGTGAIPWELDLETGQCGYLGLRIEALLGWPQDVWRKQPFWGEVVHPMDHLAFLRFLHELSHPSGPHQLEFRLRTPQGSEHWVRAVGGMEPGHAQGRVVGFLFDIHAHKRAEETALRASLKEKDLLLREIHHRVKNNLQVVSSLLRLQAASQADPALQRALQEAQDRVQAIALIHQKLKHAPDFSRLDLAGYVQTLVERLVRSYASVPALIDLRVQVAAVDIGPDAPVPLGLILNELVANALQHAFPPGTGGSLEIDLDRDAEGWVTLRVTDSGQGLPDEVNLEQGGLGFQLVQALTDQLHGVLELERRPGASFLLRFPSPSPEP